MDFEDSWNDFEISNNSSELMIKILSRVFRMIWDEDDSTSTHATPGALMQILPSEVEIRREIGLT